MEKCITMTKIPWTEKTWNVVVGCTKKSIGCKNCYALRMAWRLTHSDKPAVRAAYQSVVEKADDVIRWTGRVNCLSERLVQPLRWKKGRRIFLPSMGDLLHDSVSDEFIFDVLTVVAKCPRHTFQLLTKRPERLVHLWRKTRIDAYPNLWIGVSAENQKCFDERWGTIKQLAGVVPVLFLSLEPLLGPIDLHLMSPSGYRMLSRYYGPDGFDKTGLQPELEQPKPDWVIVGCETGPAAQPMELNWARSLRDQCQRARVAFFYKQGPDHSPMSEFRLGKAPLTNLLDGREWKEMPNETQS